MTTFRLRASKETVPRFGHSFWDALSAVDWCHSFKSVPNDYRVPNDWVNSKSPAVGADRGAHEERLVCGRLAWRPRERQQSRGYSWMRVPERPAMVSAALSRAPMMQVRPLRERANLMAARTLGSMEPLPNWPSSARRSASSAVRSSSSSWLGLPKLMATCSTAVSRNRTSASQSSASSSPPRSLSMTAGTPL